MKGYRGSHRKSPGISASVEVWRNKAGIMGQLVHTQQPSWNFASLGYSCYRCIGYTPYLFHATHHIQRSENATVARSKLATSYHRSDQTRIRFRERLILERNTADRETTTNLISFTCLFYSIRRVMYSLSVNRWYSCNLRNRFLQPTRRFMRKLLPETDRPFPDRVRYLARKQELDRRGVSLVGESL